MTEPRTVSQEVAMVELRKQVWEQAQEMVDIVLEDVQLQDYRTGVAPFGHTTTITVMDQRMGAIQSLADWLLGEK